MFSLETAERGVRLLQKMGHQTEYQTFPGLGHAVNDALASSFAKFVDRSVAD